MNLATDTSPYLLAWRRFQWVAVSFMVVFELSIYLGSLQTNAGEPVSVRHDQSPPAQIAAPVELTCSLDIELIDAKTGEALPGIVQILDSDGREVELRELVNRGMGIEDESSIHRWWVLPQRTTLTVPAVRLTVRGLSGLETELGIAHPNLTGKTHATLRMPLVRFYQARRSGYVAGNTHLHLKKMSKSQADRYLQEVPLSDGLDIVFLSYLERAGADLDYTSNKYTLADLQELSHDHVHFGHGEELRHNFGSDDEGYGHILLLGIPHLIQPVSIGPGIMKTGADSPPLQGAVDEASHLGGKVIWAHNMFGFEDIPNWLTGRVHANNIFDGGSRGSYKDTYYRYLNVGLHVPFSSGTDWFIYDFSRAYVMTDRPISPNEWLDRLASGKSYITNGPLLEFRVDGQPLGSVLDLAKPSNVSIRGHSIGRIDFKRIELVQNGRVIRTAASRKEGNHFVANLDERLRIDAPSWLALRTPPPPVRSHPELPTTDPQNEFGGSLFSHTSPIYINVAGRSTFHVDTAKGLLEQMTSDLEKIQSQGVFENDAQRKQVARVYEEAIDVLQKRLAR
jgi:hypothetical protein